MPSTRTAFAFFLLTFASFAQSPADTAAKPTDKPAAEEKKPAPPEEKPVVTKHSVKAGGKTLNYTATVGMMPIKNAEGETEAHIFYMAYTLDQPAGSPKRPLMFSFNGGPGSSSVWLHLGTIGPRRVKMLNDGGMPAPPYQVVDNDYTWLDQTDLVFIDPVGTGYSRAVKKELNKKFWGLNGDIESVGEFIRMYLTRNQRWDSPLFLVGESYGTTRAAGLAGYLINRGVAFNGIVLVSSVLDFQTLVFAPGNDLPYILFLPTYTATAWYHKKLPADLQGDLNKALKESEEFANGAYSRALFQGDKLSREERIQVAAQLSRLTGLSTQYIENSELRIEQSHFSKELLRDQRLTVGRLDGRFRGKDASNVGETFEYDPSMAAIFPPYTAAFNAYVRGELGYQTDVNYNILGGINSWDWPETGEGGFPSTSEGLRSAFAKNPYLKVYIASGHYDMATPYFATQYTLEHIGLDKEARASISTGQYEAGHMMYIQNDSLLQLKKDVSRFLQNALPATPEEHSTVGH